MVSFVVRVKNVLWLDTTVTGYRLWLPRNGNILYGRNVIFNESENISSWKDSFRDYDCVREKDDMKFAELVKDEIRDGNEIYISEISGENRRERIKEPIVECSDVIDDDINVDPCVNVEHERTRQVRERKVPKKFEDYVVSSYMASMHVECP